MGNQSAVAVSAVPTNVSTETAIATSAATNYNNPAGQGNEIGGTVNITAGTGTTAINIKVRSGAGTGGAIIGPAAGMNHTLAAGNSASITFDVLDPTVTPQPAQQYTVTVTQTGGTGAGTVNYACLYVQPATAAP